jgi:hypothetical protein
MALIIKVDGTRTPIEGQPTFKQLQDAVGGYVTVIQDLKGDVMVVNEDGRPLGLPVNEDATDLAGKLIVGDVVLCSKKEFSHAR